jgi:mono/diheme cytochrome c family protein
MSRCPILLPSALVLALAPAACGGSSASPPSPDGKALFARDCSSCHSLTGVESPRHQGGDLLHGRFSREVMLQFAREMPVPHRLNEADLQRVANYVVSVEQANR